MEKRMCKMRYKGGLLGLCWFVMIWEREASGIYENDDGLLICL